MPFDYLTDFLTALQDDGDLRRISAQVDPVLEVAEIVDRVAATPDGGPALLFEKVHGSPLPLVTNLLGSSRRVCRALGVKSLDELTEKAASLLRPEVTENWLQKLKLAPQAAQFSVWPPQMVKTGTSQQVVKMGRDVNLTDLPALQSRPLEGARFLNGALVVTRDPDSGERMFETFPLELRDANTLGVHWTPHHRAFQWYHEHARRETPMPVVIAWGGDPVLNVLVRAAAPPFITQGSYAGFLRGKGLELVKCRQVELDTPAHAEIVLEGYLEPREEWEPGGACAEATGFYGATEPVPILHVTAVTHRGNPIVSAILPSPAPSEEYWIAQAIERMDLPLLRTFIPELVDVHAPPFSAAEGFRFVSIQKRYPQQSRKVLQALWGCERTMFSRTIVVVDADVDVHNADAVWREVDRNVDPLCDLLPTEGPTQGAGRSPGSRGFGPKLGIDATRKLAAELDNTPPPVPAVMSDETRALVQRRWPEYRIGG
ncbi:MAG TPA: UbiD family decarboxylase [Planctomycetaceae bacterium]|nr:UbiD family decarboxylase [Planctomycetaceae bacterium]